MGTTSRRLRILAADIGGTNSRFAAFAAGEDGELTMEARLSLPTADYASFGGLLDALADSAFGLPAAEADAAVLAVPGAVKGGAYAKPPNIPWDMDLATVRGRFVKGPALLINDFVAQGHACLSPVVRDALAVKPGSPQPDGAVAAIGAGTGLGHCALLRDDRGGWVAAPSEAGHAAFAFHGPQEEEYQRFVCGVTGHSYAYAELVVSGQGLSLAHRFLTGQSLTPAEAAARLPDNPDVAALFARLYGRACRNYALAVLATGGVYVMGGVAAKNPSLVDNPAFVAEFLDQPRYGWLLSAIPVLLNRNEDSGLWGAALRGLLALGRGPLQPRF